MTRVAETGGEQPRRRRRTGIGADLPLVSQDQVQFRPDRAVVRLGPVVPLQFRGHLSADGPVGPAVVVTAELTAQHRMLVDQRLPRGAEHAEIECAGDVEHVLNDSDARIVIAGRLEQDAVLQRGQGEPHRASPPVAHVFHTAFPRRCSAELRQHGLQAGEQIRRLLDVDIRFGLVKFGLGADPPTARRGHGAGGGTGGDVDP